MQLYRVRATHWSNPTVLETIHGTSDAAENRAVDLAIILERDAVDDGHLDNVLDPALTWQSRLLGVTQAIAHLGDAPTIDVAALTLDLPDDHPLAGLAQAAYAAICYQEDLFDNDRSVSGADLVDWWAETRQDLKQLLAQAAAASNA
jgi:hypothetical protein